MSRRKTDVDAVRLDIEERGAQIAYAALLEVCQNGKAPAQAKAAAGVAILRAGGLYDAKRRPVKDEDPSEMSSEELRRALPTLLREIAELEASIAKRQRIIDAAADEGIDDDIFG